MSETDRYLSLIEEYLDEALPAAEQAEMEDHVAACDACRAEVDAYRRLRRLSFAFPPVEIPDDLGYRIRRRLDGPMAAARTSRRRGKVVNFLFATAAAAAAALLLFVLFDRERPDPPARLPAVVAVLDDASLDDWIDQARNATPKDAPMLAAEAHELGLLGAVRERIRSSRGAERRYLLSCEYLLIQLANDPDTPDLPGEAGLVAMARFP